MEFITFKNKKYPKFQAEGFAAKFAFPFAKEVCKGVGYDIGCNRLEWCFPGAIAIDPNISKNDDAMNLPLPEVDYIFSSHCLEHLDNWVDALDYWTTKIISGGTMFLYLPDISQEYWHPWNNRKHKHVFTPDIIKSYFTGNVGNWSKIWVSGVDLNSSFIVMAEKK